MRCTAARWLALLLTSLVLLTADASWAEDPAPSEEGFVGQLGRIRRAKERGSCGTAKRLLDSLLEEHAKQPYVMSRVVEIKALARQLAFGEACDSPDPKDLVSGDLITYTKLSNRIKIRYSSWNMEGDWERRDGFLTHGGGFAGPFTLRIESRNWPQHPQQNAVLVFGGMDHPKTGRRQSWIFSLGSDPWREGRELRSFPTAFTHLDGKEENELEVKSAFRRSGKFVLELKVTSNKIRLRINGERYGPYDKHRDVFGNISLGFRKPNQIEIQGVIEPSWIQRKIDAKIAKDRAEFEKSFKYEDHLPAWLLNSGTSGSFFSRLAMPRHPTGATKLQIFTHDALYGLLVSGQGLIARQRLEALEERILLPASRDYLLAVDHLLHGRRDAALTAARAARKEDKDFLMPSVLESITHHLNGDPAKAKSAIAQISKTYDLDEGIFFQIASRFMHAGRFDASQTVVRYAASLGIRTPLMARLQTAIFKATRGPDWQNTFDRKTAHYHVFTDIDQRTCSEAALLLERMYRHVERELERVDPEAEKRRFKVYLFRGEQGFRNYIRGLGTLGGGPASHMAAGLYDPFLKQLLIWNLPEREEMLGTIRHEGFHQYLDQALPEAPVWFNEGLAVYFENSAVHRSRIESGQINGYGVRVLEKVGLVPLATFIARDHQAFYANPDHSYAQAWLIIHFLRKGPTWARAIFGEVWQALESATPHTALAKVLHDERLRRLDKELERYLRELIQAR